VARFFDRLIHTLGAGHMGNTPKNKVSLERRIVMTFLWASWLPPLITGIVLILGIFSDGSGLDILYVPLLIFDFLIMPLAWIISVGALLIATFMALFYIRTPKTLLLAVQSIGFAIALYFADLGPYWFLGHSQIWLRIQYGVLLLTSLLIGVSLWKRTSTPPSA
jgi:hypothetical protein